MPARTRPNSPAAAVFTWKKALGEIAKLRPQRRSTSTASPAILVCGRSAGGADLP
eukprot:CAMPEP_0185556450 /NCGR_PEP_ID=MMETSP1381-20130426/47231_1 /TAXON_ID=298111 /ORGANISM="Pavlova sp., Strain CCMP459" /LENGTH=54 /DNA_ID=CAMNT_0028169831 /DNA_START=92 /DNA_END=252 /DNA_ORIENTATION=-